MRSPVPPGSSSLHRQTDRAGQELRRPSCHRYRERAAAQRTGSAQSTRSSRTATSEVLQVISSARRAILSRCSQPCWRTPRASATRQFGNIYRLVMAMPFGIVASHGTPGCIRRGCVSVYHFVPITRTPLRRHDRDQSRRFISPISLLQRTTWSRIRALLTAS